MIVFVALMENFMNVLLSLLVEFFSNAFLIRYYVKNSVQLVMIQVLQKSYWKTFVKKETEIQY